jgi:serine/threonine protein kinase
MSESSIDLSRLFVLDKDGRPTPLNPTMLKVLRELGRGSYGVVSLVQCAEGTGRPFVMKEIDLAEGGEDARYAAREVRDCGVHSTAREARVRLHARSPHIAFLFQIEWLLATRCSSHFLRFLGWSGNLGAFRPDGRRGHGCVQLFTEFCNSGTVDDDMASRIATWRHFTSEEIAEFISEVSAGLRDLHSLKGIHRDIKPQNVLVHHFNGVKTFVVRESPTAVGLASNRS